MQGSKSSRSERPKRENWFRTQGPWANAWSMERYSPEKDQEEPGKRDGREAGPTSSTPPKVTPSE
jgi:hypothetical protein